MITLNWESCKNKFLTWRTFSRWKETELLLSTLTWMKNTRNYSRKTTDWKGWSMRNLSKSYKDKICSWNSSWRERLMMIYLKALWSPKIPLPMEVVWKTKGSRVRTIIEPRNIGRLRKQGPMTFFRIRTKFIQSIG